MVETGNNPEAKGESGENTAFQFMASSWMAWSTKYVGYEMPQTEGNARYLATLRVSHLLEQGYTPEEVALIWNSGGTTHRVGTNKYGADYNTYAYVDKFNRYYR